MIIGPRFDDYRMRTGTYRGDGIESHSRRINGTPYDFVRIAWASGDVTIRAYKGMTSTLLHEWNSR